ncbi:MAG: hypothetical protein KME64_08280 [Scytonematopsis contorta HA4267-MV1]|jgi:arsenate reductase-like glutaredoxin family protein|nr:hypothetical protein [Scytonematopsis contorta HA4267-MV1]
MLTPELEAANTNTSPERLNELLQKSPELAAVIANNENTSPELLQELSTSEDEQIRQAVAANPNTPTDVLFKLGEEFPQELLDNPVFSLLLLENPNFMQDIPEATLVNLIKLPSIPDSFLQWVLNSSNEPQILFFITMNPKVSKEDLQKLINKFQRHWNSEQIQQVAKLHVNWSGEMEWGWEEAALEVVQKRQLYKDRIVHKELSEYSLWQIGVIPESFLTTLDFKTITKIAQHPETPGYILQALLKNPRAAINKVRVAIASNLNTPVHLLEELAGDENKRVRRNVFLNPNTPNVIFQRFQEYERAIGNTNTSPEELMRIPTNEWMHISKGVASHPNTPKEVLLKLATNKSWKMRLAVAKNSNISDDILAILQQDNIKTVREESSKTLKRKLNNTKDIQTDYVYLEKKCELYLDDLQNIVGSKNKYIPPQIINHLCQKIALDLDISDTFLDRCALTHSIDLQTALARHPKISESIFEQLMKSRSPRLRQLLTQNQNLPINLLKKLLNNNNYKIRQAVLIALQKNPLARRDKDLNNFWQQWNMAQNVNTPDETLAKLAQSKWVLIREAVAQHPKAAMIIYQLDKPAKKDDKTNIPATLIEKLIVDKNQAVRIAVAKNPHTPIDILEELADTNFCNEPIHLAAVKTLIKQYPESDILDLDNYIWQHPCPSLSGFFVLLHPLTPSDVLVKYFRSWSWLERYAIATNPNTPVHIRQRLAEDANRIVRAGAKSYL